MLLKKSLIPILSLLAIITVLPMQAQSLKSELESSPPSKMRCMKGVELYLWHWQGKPVYTILHGTNRLKFTQEIHNPKEAIKSLSELEKLLGKLAPREYVIFKDETRAEGNPTPSSESAAVKKLCERLDLNFSGDIADTTPNGK